MFSYNDALCYSARQYKIVLCFSLKTIFTYYQFRIALVLFNYKGNYKNTFLCLHYDFFFVISDNISKKKS